MTFSVLARDPQSGAIGAAAATGSLCVGGWVIRGNPNTGMSASQGAKPSTMWGEDVLTLMAAGSSAHAAINAVTQSDSGAEYRQLAALDLQGNGAIYTGENNGNARGGRWEKDLVVSGNLLTDLKVLDVMVDTMQGSKACFEEKLIETLVAAQQAGGDHRGLLSASLLVFRPDTPPLTLRIDYHETPLTALQRLYEQYQDSDYQRWLTTLPTRENPER